MTLKTCGICDRKTKEHSSDQIYDCFSDAGFEIKFDTGSALHIAREFKLLKKYSPGIRGWPAKLWFKDDPNNMVETDDLPEAIFLAALPLLEAQEKKEFTGGIGVVEPEDEPEEEDPDEKVWDDETVARMEDASDDHTIDTKLEPPDKSEG